MLVIMLFRPVFIISKYRILLYTFGVVIDTVASVTHKYTRIVVYYLVIMCLQMNADINNILPFLGKLKNSNDNRSPNDYSRQKGKTITVLYNNQSRVEW